MTQPGPPSVSAQLSLRRGRAAVEFYRAAFGAEEIYRVGGTDDHEAVVSQLRVGRRLGADRRDQRAADAQERAGRL